MSQVLIVIDDPKNWGPYYPSDSVITFSDYLSLDLTQQQRVRVINLCSDYAYLKPGYYCSLLAEARGHHVIPSPRVLNDLSHPMLYQIQLSGLVPAIDKALKSKDKNSVITIKSFFGAVVEPEFQPLARLLFEKFACPIMQFTLGFNVRWEITDIRMLGEPQLSDDEQTQFANALDNFSRKVWRENTAKKSARYDLAILVNSEEKLPPSDPVAIRKFIAAGKSLGVNVELISPDDFMRIPEFDALFIRETTAIDHHTYRFAKKAEAEGLVVMDDPSSMLRCTNKVYLAKLFETHGVPAPKTIILRQDKPEMLKEAIHTLGFPMVLKIPDGSFSRGMAKVENEQALKEKAIELFEKSSLLLAQEYLYTDFDWRIGILDNKPLYACRYYMVKNHWQIYKHETGAKVASGKFDTLPSFEVPKPILQAAIKATKPIGDGFYGVDVKESKGKGYVIEVNDNPSIDSAVEDKYLGNELYKLIMQEFIRRIELKRHG